MSRHRPDGAVRLQIVPVAFPEACAFVAAHHRHHRPPQGHKFSLGVATLDGTLVGVAIIGRPVARSLDDKVTVEITRLATDGTPNACSALLRAAWRTAHSAGYRRLITYTQATESGASLRGAGLHKVAELPPNTGWDRPNRPRQPTGNENVARVRWEITVASPSGSASGDTPATANDARRGGGRL